MRLFFALPLPPAALSAAAREQAGLRAAAGPRARLSFGDPAQLHVSLAFLGEQPSAAAAIAAGESAFAGARGFPVALGGLGCFPRPQRPRVLWLGLTEGAEALAALAASLAAALRARGIALEDRPFQAHVTLARARPGAERDAARALAAAVPAAVSGPAPSLARFLASRLSLVQSQLGSGGARHAEVASFPLAEPA